MRIVSKLESNVDKCAHYIHYNITKVDKCVDYIHHITKVNKCIHITKMTTYL